MGLNYYQIKKNVLKARKLVIRGTSIAGSLQFVFVVVTKGANRSRKEITEQLLTQ